MALVAVAATVVALTAAGQQNRPPPTPTPPPSDENTPNRPPADVAEAPSPKPPASPYTTAWNLPIAADGPLSLTLVDSMILLSGPDTAIEARAADDGRVLWTSAHRMDRTPVSVQGRLIGPVERALVALDLATGVEAWKADLTASTVAPIAAGDLVLVPDGTALRAHRAADGVLVWRQDLGAEALVPPAIDPARVFLALHDRTLAALARLDGRLLWRAPIEVTPRSLAAGGDRLFLGGAEGFACAHRIEHGRKDWCFNVRVRPVGTPAMDEERVYFAFLDNMIHVFDRESGRRYNTPSLGALPSDGPTLTADALIVPVVTGEFVLLDPRAGYALTRVSSPRSAELPYTRAAAISPDGSVLAMVIATPGGRTLISFRRTPPDAPAKTGDTASDTPPAPRAP